MISIEAEAGCEWINDELEYTNIVPKPDDNGEWVKWEDIEKLISEDRILSVESVKMIEKMYEIVMKGNKL
jgi:hypothetical protein